jgi:hypothetical protein
MASKKHPRNTFNSILLGEINQERISFSTYLSFVSITALFK